jgi:hypothetical protein
MVPNLVNQVFDNAITIKFSCLIIFFQISRIIGDETCWDVQEANQETSGDSYAKMDAVANLREQPLLTEFDQSVTPMDKRCEEDTYDEKKGLYSLKKVCLENSY